MPKQRLLPLVEIRLTNATAEGLNRIIKIVKNRASGFRDLGAFSDLIYLTVGDFNILEQIRAKLIMLFVKNEDLIPMFRIYYNSIPQFII